jgi:hypothetical protein
MNGSSSSGGVSTTTTAPIHSSMHSLRSASMNNTNNGAATTQLVNFKPPTVIHNKLFQTQKTALGSKSTDCIRAKQLASTPSSHSINSPNERTSLSQPPPANTNNTTNNTTATGQKTNLIKETRSYILDYVLVPGSKTTATQRISIQEAKKRGILNLEHGLYIDTFKNVSVSIDEAIKAGLIGARMAMCEKNFVIEETGAAAKTETISDKNDLKQPVLKPSVTADEVELKRSHETSTLTIESILDARTGIRLSIGDAINAGILDQAQLAYKNTLTGQLMSLNEAFERGFVKGNLSSKNFVNGQQIVAPLQPPPYEQIASNRLVYTKSGNGDETVVESEAEKCYRINRMYDPVTKAFVTLPQAIKTGIFNREKGVYVDPLSDSELTIKEAHTLGLIQAELVSNLEGIVGDKVCRINVGSENKPLKGQLLYEVRDVEEVKATAATAARVTKQTVPDALPPSTVHRIELVVDDDEEDAETTAGDDILGVGKVRLRNSFRVGVNSSGNRALERQIPSSYESGVPATFAETLVIDDVRRSTMLEIDGLSHVFKNEVSIDADQLATSTPNTAMNAKTLVVIDSGLKSTVAVADNMTTSTSGHQKSAKRSSLTRESSVSSLNSVQKSDPLKISITKNGSLSSLHGNNHNYDNGVGDGDDGARKDETDMRAQFERALRQLESENYPKIKNVKLSTSNSDLVSFVKTFVLF